MPRKSRKQALYEALDTLTTNAAAMQARFTGASLSADEAAAEVGAFMDALWRTCIGLDLRFTDKAMKHNRDIATILAGRTEVAPDAGDEAAPEEADGHGDDASDEAE